MTLFLMPTMYAVFNRKDDARRIKAEAHREEIASGHKARATANSDLNKIEEEEEDAED
jgi:hypothetical protein